MKIIRAPSQTSQVVDFIRREILAGKLPPNARLDSLRTLSSRIKVGRQVVLSAFEILEKEGLIARRPRRGFFVSGKAANYKTRSVYFWSYGADVTNKYLGKMLQMTCPPFLRENYNFITRIVPSSQQNPKIFVCDIRTV